jgi:multidrug efflux pump subunit AcrA (membrane-fusion protein)
MKDGAGLARQRELKLGRTLGDDREVLEGLSGGETVVVEPPEKLADGESVRIAREGSADSDNNE